MAKDAQGRVGNNSRKLTNLVRKYSPKKVQLTLSQGKMKKGDEVAYDGGGDALRTSVSQDQVTATLGTENCSSALSIWGGYVWSTQYFQLPRLGFTLPSCTSIWVTRFLIRADFSIQLFCDWGRR